MITIIEAAEFAIIALAWTLFQIAKPTLVILIIAYLLGLVV
jgi:hypothetical protein